MCLIINNLDGKDIPFSVIRQTVMSNKDGYGRLDIPSGKIRRTMNMEEAVKIAMEPGKAVHHFRLSTAGSKSIENTHPFLITKNWVLFHNGVVNNFNGTTASDTANLSKFLAAMNKSKWKEVLEMFDSSRFLVVHRRTGEKIQVGSQWTERDGIWYSNSNHFRNHSYVAVIEELAEDGVLNKRFFPHKSDFVDYGRTANKHRLCFNGVPFLLYGEKEEAGVTRGNEVAMDIYEVSDSDLAALDKLHGGNKGFYERKMVEFETIESGSVWAWVYFCTDERMDSGEYFYYKGFDERKKKKETSSTMSVVGKTGHSYRSYLGYRTFWDGDDWESVRGGAPTSTHITNDDDDDLDMYDDFYSKKDIADLADLGIHVSEVDGNKSKFCNELGDPVSEETVLQYLSAIDDKEQTVI